MVSPLLTLNSLHETLERCNLKLCIRMSVTLKWSFPTNDRMLLGYKNGILFLFFEPVNSLKGIFIIKINILIYFVTIKYDE